MKTAKATPSLIKPPFRFSRRVTAADAALLAAAWLFVLTQLAAAG